MYIRYLDSLDWSHQIPGIIGYDPFVFSACRRGQATNSIVAQRVVFHVSYTEYEERLW